MNVESRSPGTGPGSMTVTVRAATAADAPELARLLAELGYPTPAAEIPSRLERLVRQGRGGAALVAVGPGGVIGLAWVELQAPLNRPRPSALLSGLVVSQTARGIGVGRRLVDAVEAFAREHGCGRLVVGSGEQRTGAHAFYRRLGWTPNGRRFARPLEP